MVITGINYLLMIKQLCIIKTQSNIFMEQKTMAPAINAHKDIPGNPSTAKSSKIKLNDRTNGKPLNLLNEEDWKLTQPDDRDHFKPDTTGFEIVKVKMNAGDLLIFNSTEPHGIRPNRSKDKVRLAQYISMMPAEEDNEELRKWRITSWKERKAPEGYAFPGDPRNWEQTKYTTAELSPLGKKLLGLEKW